VTEPLSGGIEKLMVKCVRSIDQDPIAHTIFRWP